MPVRTIRTILALGGALLLGAAVGFSNEGMELSLRGSADGSLAWGPSLWRVMAAFHGVVLLLAALLPAAWKAPLRIARPTLGSGSSLEWIGVGALTLLALALRLYRIEGQLWVDEVFTLVDFLRAPAAEIITRFPSQNQHLLYSLLGRASLVVFGESAFAIRLPAVLLGVATVPALYLLGRRLIGPLPAGLAAGLLTVSYHHIWFSQNARGYSGLLFFAVLATWLWLRARERGGFALWSAYSLALLGGLWMHMTMLFVVAAHGLVWLAAILSKRGRGESLDFRQELLGPLGAWLFAGTLSLQVYALALPEFFAVALHEQSNQSDWTEPLWVVYETLRNLQVGFSGWAVVALGGVVGLIGWLDLWRKDRAAAAGMLLPGLLGGGVVVAMGHNIWPRFFFFCAGFVLLVALNGAFAAARLVLRERWARRVGIAVGAVLILGSAATVPRGYALPKQDFLGAKRYVEAHAQTGEPRLAVGLAGRMYALYYAPEWTETPTASELRAALEPGRRAWLAYTLSPEIRAFQPEVWEIIEREFEVAEVFWGTLGEGEIYVCRRKEELFNP